MLLRKNFKRIRSGFQKCLVSSVKNGFREMFNAISELKLVSKMACLTSIYFLNTWKPSPRTNFSWHPWHLWEIKTSSEWMTEVSPPTKKYVKVLINSKFTSRYCILIIFPFLISFHYFYHFLSKGSGDLYTHVHSLGRISWRGSITWLLIQKNGGSLFFYRHVHNCTMKSADCPCFEYKISRISLLNSWSNIFSESFHFYNFLLFL